jgi:hypothetical protein
MLYNNENICVCTFFKVLCNLVDAHIQKCRQSSSKLLPPKLLKWKPSPAKLMSEVYMVLATLMKIADNHVQTCKLISFGRRSKRATEQVDTTKFIKDFGRLKNKIHAGEPATKKMRHRYVCTR